MSTAPWDQPRNGTTVTLEGAGVDTFTEAELIDGLQQRSIRQGRSPLPDLRIEVIHSRKPGGFGLSPSVCMLISWANKR